ncbi:MAG: tetratricopeptide repeat protein [Bacillota bacterium]|nr:tetratricopeptide repeat protein [Bacillota bacterium]MDW7683885.1 tetratricopeptide repeat protein [Bacillota bacterium]
MYDEGQNAKKSIFRKIPGYRSKKPWKMAIASVFYFFVLLIIITPSSDKEAPAETTPAVTQSSETPEEKQARMLQESAESYQTGLRFYEQKDYTAAQQKFQKVIKDDPDYEDAQAKITEIKTARATELLALAKEKIDQGLFGDAETDLRAALNNNPDLKEATDLVEKLPDLEKEHYKKSCKAIEFKVLNKNPDSLVGERVTMKGEVLQIQESGNFTIMLVQVTNLGYDVYTDTVMVTYDGTIDIYEDDIIAFWGEVVGSETYQSVAGWNVTVPKVSGRFFAKRK